MNVSKYCADPQKQGTRRSDADSDEGLRRKKKKGPSRVLTVSFLLIIVALVAIGVVVVVPMLNKSARHTAIIKVPRNATENQVEDSVAKYLGSDYAEDLHQAMIIAGGRSLMRHGAYKIEEGMTPMEGARVLTHGGQTGIRVTLQNERDKLSLARKFAAKLDVPADSLLAALNDAEFLKKCDTDPDYVMIIFLADTYEFYWTVSAQEIVRKMRNVYDSFWTPQRLERAEQLHLSPRQVAVLASIVDEETNQAAEKGTIGRLYINRLQKGMKLQADPTVKYAIGDFGIKRVTNEMTRCDSPFNTYMYGGLPPGPIRTTSAATIDAILSSRPHDYLYMCAKEDFSGSHNFAVTYEEHLQNARRYQAALDKAGIK